MFPEDGVVKILVPSHIFYTIHTLYLDDLSVTTKSVWFTPAVKKVVQRWIHMFARLIVQTVRSSCTRES